MTEHKKSETLELCPFCWHDAELVEYKRGSYITYAVECTNCTRYFEEGAVKEEVIANWNRGCLQRRRKSHMSVQTEQIGYLHLIEGDVS